MSILVTGATGNVGRHLVRQLAESGRRVRAFTREPDSADLPDGVEAVGGDLTDGSTVEAALEGVEALHLITTHGPSYRTLPNGPQIADLAAAAGVRRVTVLWNGYRGPVEDAIEAAGLEWTWIRPGDFMANALTWAEEIRNEGVLRDVYGHLSRRPIHEADIAAVAAAALTGEGHAGKAYTLVGPETLTLPEHARVLSRAIGREVRFEELPEQRARERMRSMGVDDEAIDFILGWKADPSNEEALIAEADDVEAIIGRPPLTFEQWAAAHAGAFR